MRVLNYIREFLNLVTSDSMQEPDTEISITETDPSLVEASIILRNSLLGFYDTAESQQEAMGRMLHLGYCVDGDLCLQKIM